MRYVGMMFLVLAGCATAPVTQPAVQTTHLLCDRTIPIDVSHDGQTAVARNREGNQVVLQRVAAAPGVRYEGSGITLMRTEGTYIYIARDGSTYGCEPLRR